MGTIQEKLTYKSYSLSFNHILDKQLIYSSVAQKKKHSKGNTVPLDGLSEASEWLFVSGGKARFISCI